MKALYARKASLPLLLGGNVSFCLVLGDLSYLYQAIGVIELRPLHDGKSLDTRKPFLQDHLLEAGEDRPREVIERSDHDEVCDLGIGLQEIQHPLCLVGRDVGEPAAFDVAIEIPMVSPGNLLDEIKNVLPRV